MYRFQTKFSYNLFFISIFLYLIPSAQCEKRIFAAEDMLKLEEVVITHVKAIWNITHEVYQTEIVTQALMRNYSHEVREILAQVQLALMFYGLRVYSMQPDQLLNRLIDLQELPILTKLSETPSDDPIINWKVKWVEVSSLATHITWLYDKRIRDILTSIPYLKTIATSIAVYYGNPWRSVLSGNTEKERRVPMRYFTRQIDETLFSVPQGDLFFGLHKLLSESRAGKAGSSVKSGTCAGEELTGKILPVRLDAPLYVLFYLCLVDFKYYVLENYFQIYREAYTGYAFPNYSTSDDRLRQRIKRKIDAYNLSFKNYKTSENQVKKVMQGYFHCDPISIDPFSEIRNHIPDKTFIRFTNFLTVFVALEKTLSPSEKCGGTCQGIGKANDYCKSEDSKCLAKVHSECEKDPLLCEKFSPPCPVQYLSCWASGKMSDVCQSENLLRMYDWIDLDGKTYGPKEQSKECGQRTSKFEGTEDCEVCLCQCLEPISIQGNSSSVRLFSMKEAVSRIEDNRVVVGLKFEQIEDQIHFMVADAVSKKDFMVDSSTVAWLTPTASDSSKPEEVQRLSKTLKTFHLEDLKADDGYVVTGIRFVSKTKPLRTPDSETEFYIGVSIRTTQVDPSTGDLDTGTSVWTDTETGNPTQYNYEDPDDPVKTDGPAVPDSTTNQFIEFRASSFKKDAGQTVIPYFDAQKMMVESKTVNAIRGIGVFHKHKPGFGGFLGVKILPYGDFNTL